jgi:hypothetical protein
MLGVARAPKDPQFHLAMAAAFLVILAIIGKSGKAEPAEMADPIPLDVAYITDNPGGAVDDFLVLREEFRQWNTEVKISGTCASACTLFTDLERACVFKGAKLGFHAPYLRFPDIDGTRVYSAGITQDFVKELPPRIQKWLADHGGLQPSLVWLKGKELYDLVPLCKGEPITD